MKKQRNSGKVLIWIACVLSFVAVAINTVAVVVISFDIGGILTRVEEIVNEMGFTLVGADLTFTCIELLIVILIDLFAGLRYLKIARNRLSVFRPGNNLMFQTVFQILVGSLIAGIFGLIGLSKLTSRRRPVPITPEESIEFMNDYKKKAMSEAIARLKELKSQGAISDEEYYETLNKILEG